MILSSHWEVWLSQQPQTPKLTDPNSKGIFVFLSITSGWESSNNHKGAGHFTGQNESSGAHLKFTNKIQPQFHMGFTLSPHTRFSVFPIFSVLTYDFGERGQNICPPWDRISTAAEITHQLRVCLALPEDLRLGEGGDCFLCFLSYCFICSIIQNGHHTTLISCSFLRG